MNQSVCYVLADFNLNRTKCSPQLHFGFTDKNAATLHTTACDPALFLLQDSSKFSMSHSNLRLLSAPHSTYIKPTTITNGLFIPSNGNLSNNDMMRFNYMNSPPPQERENIDHFAKYVNLLLLE